MEGRAGPPPTLAKPSRVPPTLAVGQVLLLGCGVCRRRPSARRRWDFGAAAIPDLRGRGLGTCLCHRLPGEASSCAMCEPFGFAGGRGPGEGGACCAALRPPVLERTRSTTRWSLSFPCIERRT